MLRSLGMDIEIYPPQIEELKPIGASPLEYARHNAGEKANWVSQHTTFDLIIAADTVVTKDGQIFEKPQDREDAVRMLTTLSDSTHLVITGFCLLSNRQQFIEHEITKVTFYPLSNDEITMYVQSGEPFDKAGAYGIQGFASLFIKEIEGCYFNVVGFPIGKFYQRLKTMKF